MASTNDLVPKDTLEEIKKLEEAAKRVVEALKNLMNQSAEVNNTLKQQAPSYRELNKAISEHNEIEKKATAAQKEQSRIQSEMERIRLRTTSATSEEGKELEKLRLKLQQATRETRNQIKENQAASGSIDQMRATLARLRAEYNALTSDRRNSPFGENLKNQIDSLNASIKSSSGSGTGLFGTILSANFWANIATKAVEAIGKMFTAAKDFVAEGIRMASSGEGIIRAFNNLNRPGLLDNLREATRGTVSDLNLMRTAVRAENFRIPLEQLGSLLQFAQQRAADTGESVDYLVDSIITGLGRQSVLILDNLQIAPERIREETKKTGDFVTAAINLINEELEAQGTQALTSADKAAIASVKWQNAQLQIGEKFVFVKNLWSEFSGAIADTVSSWTETWVPKMIQGVEDVINYFINLYNNFVIVRGAIESIGLISTTVWETVRLFVGQAARLFLGLGEVIKSVLTFDIDGAKTALNNLNQSLADAVEKGANAIVDRFYDAKSEIQNGFIVPITFETQTNGAGNNRNQNGNQDGEDELTEEQKKAIEAEKKAYQDLMLFRINREAEAQKQIIDDTNKSFEDRRAAIDKFYAFQVDSINQSAKNQLSAENLTNSQRLLIQEKQQAELLKLAYTYDKMILDIEKKRTDEIIKEQDKLYRSQMRLQQSKIRSANMSTDEAESGELVDLSKQYADGEIKREEYEKRKTDISIKYAEERMKNEIKSLEELSKITGFSADQQEEITRKLEDARLKYNIFVNNELIKEETRAAKKREDIEKALADKRKELIGEVYSFIGNLISSNFESQIESLDKQSEANEEWREKEIERIDEQEQKGVYSKEKADAQRAYVDEVAAQREEQLDQKRKEVLERQARYEKAQAIIGIAINTAQAITKQLALTPLPIGAPLIATIAAIGAAQLASVIAQTIPEYAEGTDFHPGGLAVVGDGGRPELGILPSGKMFVTPSVPTVMDLARGTEIIPDITPFLAKEATKMPLQQAEKPILVNINNKELIKAQKEFGKKIDNLSLTVSKIRGNTFHSNTSGFTNYRVTYKK